MFCPYFLITADNMQEVEENWSPAWPLSSHAQPSAVPELSPHDELIALLLHTFVFFINICFIFRACSHGQGESRGHEQVKNKEQEQEVGGRRQEAGDRRHQE